MYIPPAFREDRPEVLATLIAGHPLGLLISNGASGLVANPVPMLLANGVLRAHLARANPQLADLRDGAEVLVVFQGPQGYVSPGWYPAKADHGRVVPTWNYLTVQARGLPRVIEDANWLRAQVDDLTLAQETARPAPWAVSDAPEPFVAAQLRGICGVEIAVTALTGKWKASQNRSAADRTCVIAGLAAEGSPLAPFIPPPETA